MVPKHDSLSDQKNTHQSTPLLSTSKSLLALTKPKLVAATFGAFFIMGVVDAFFKYDETWLELMIHGAKLGIAGTLAVLCIPAVAISLAAVRAPQWFVSGGSFAVGFFILGGLAALLERKYAIALGKAGSGFLIGFCIGLGIYASQFRRTSKRSSTGEKDEKVS